MKRKQKNKALLKRMFAAFLCFLVLLNSIHLPEMAYAYSLPSGFKTFSTLKSGAVSLSGTTGYHKITDIKTASVNGTTDSDSGKSSTYDTMQATNASRVLYQKLFSVAYNTKLSLVAGKDGGENDSNAENLAWSVEEWDANGNFLWDSGWLYTKDSYVVGKSTCGSTLSLTGLGSRENVKYISIIFRRVADDGLGNGGGQDAAMTPTQLGTFFPTLYICYKPFYYTVKNSSGTAVGGFNRTGVEATTALSNYQPADKTGYTTSWTIGSSSAITPNWMDGNTYPAAWVNERLANGKFYNSFFGAVSFQAKYVPHVYEVSYNANGGTGEMENSSHTYDVEKALTANAFTKTGYSFDGWATTASGAAVYDDGESVKNLSATDGDTVKLYAKWKANTYKITLDNQGAGTAGTGAYYELYNSGNYKESGCTNSISSITIPVKTGYTFGGYYTKKDGGGTCYVDASGNITSKKITFSADTTLYAYWTAGSYTISYDANGGTGAPADQSYDYAASGSVTLSSTKPTRTGYTFLGWATSSTATAKDYSAGGSFSKSVTKNTTLYAVWSADIYKITLDNQSATTDGTAAYYLKYDSGNYKESGCTNSISSITIPAKTGYTFGGYYTAKNGGGTCYVDASGNITSKKTTFSADTTLYAKWTANSYTISYDANGGTGAPADQSYTYAASGSVTLSSTIPKRTGYTFLGWATSSTATAKDYSAGGSFSKSVAQNTTLYAVWSANTYKITLDSQGAGTAGTAAYYLKYDSGNYKEQACANSISSITIPVKNGYKFGGYYTATNGGGTQYIDASGNITSKKTTFSADTTLYAKWTAASYTISYSANGGTGAPADQSYTYAASGSVTLSSTIPKRTGYTFLGWATSSTATAKDYSAGGSFSKSVAQNTTLYAVWQINTYRITYNANGGTTSATAKNYSYRGEVDLSPTATKKGYTFVGWAASSTARIPLSAFSMPAADTTLYAVYTIEVSDIENHDYPAYTPTPDKVDDEFYLLVWLKSNSAKYKIYPLSYQKDMNTMVYRYTCPANIKSFVGENVYCYRLIVRDNAGNETVLRQGSSDGGTPTPPPELPKEYPQTVNHYKTDPNTNAPKLFDTTVEMVLEGKTFTPAYITPPAGYETDTKDGGGTVTAAKTYSAFYKPKSFTITFNAKGGTCDTASKSILYGAYYGKLPLPIKEGHAFKGWYENENYTGKPVTSSDVYNKTTNTTLYAKWEANVYKITLDSQDTDSAGTGAYYEKYNTGNYTTEACTAAITKITRPGKVGYTFGGYYTGKEGTGTCYVDASGNIKTLTTPKYKDFKADTILYAKWTPIEYTIRYHANGGTGTMADTIVTYDKPVTLKSNAFTRTGYTFEGWATSETGTVVYEDGESVKNLSSVNGAVINLHAVWKAKVYEITLDNQGADSAGTGVYYEKYNTGNYTTEACSTSITKITRPGKVGYTFGGYYTGKDGSGTQYVDASGTIKTHTTVKYTDFTSDTILYAKWTPIEYTIRYHANGGSGTMADTPATYDKSVSLKSNAFMRTGYTFEGWATSETGTVVYEDGEIVKNLASANGVTVNLYAKWTANTYTVTLDSQEADNPGTAGYYALYENGVYKEEACTNAITKITLPKKTGYTFGGYYTGKDGTGTCYVDASGNIKTLTTPKYKDYTSDTILYAKWTPNSYTIQYHANGGSGTMEPTPATYDISVTLPGNSFERTGYTFKGWSTTQNGTKVYEDKDKVMNLTAENGKTVTLYAVWSINSYTVTYDYITNGGMLATAESKNVTYGTAIDLTVTAVKDGYTFVGWNTVPAATAKIDSLTMGTENVTLYAIFEKTITVTLVEKANTGTVMTNLSDTLYNNDRYADFIIREKAVWDGWKNIGWTYKTSATENAVISTGATYTTDESITLYAIYASDVTVSYDSNGSTVEFDAQTQKRYYNASGDFFYPTFKIAKAPVLAQNSFDKWVAEDGMEYEADTDVLMEKDTLLTARWDKHPELSASNRYFTLEDAQNGVITHTELLKKVVATDKEDGILVNGTDVIVKDYNASIFTGMTEDAEVVITYQATDSFGNVVTKEVAVIVTDTTMKESPQKTYIRFISSDFFTDDAGNLISADKGGLEENSIWRKNPTYRSLLQHALSHENMGEESYLFTSRDIKWIKEYTNTYGSMLNAVEEFFEFLLTKRF